MFSEGSQQKAQKIIIERGSLSMDTIYRRIKNDGDREIYRSDQHCYNFIILLL